MEFSRQEYWSGLPLPSPGDLSHPGIESAPLGHFFLHWQADSLPLRHLGSPNDLYYIIIAIIYNIYFTENDNIWYHIYNNILYYVFLLYTIKGFPVAQLVKNQPAMRETWVQSRSWEVPLEKGKATHSNILAWRIP